MLYLICSGTSCTYPCGLEISSAKTGRQSVNHPLSSTALWVIQFRGSQPWLCRRILWEALEHVNTQASPSEILISQVLVRAGTLSISDLGPFHSADGNTEAWLKTKQLIKSQFLRPENHRTDFQYYTLYTLLPI